MELEIGEDKGAKPSGNSDGFNISKIVNPPLEVQPLTKLLPTPPSPAPAVHEDAVDLDAPHPDAVDLDAPHPDAVDISNPASSTPETDQFTDRVQSSVPNKAALPQKQTPNLGPLGLNPDISPSSLSLDVSVPDAKQRKNLVTNEIDQLQYAGVKVPKVTIPNTSSVNTYDMIHTLQSNVEMFTNNSNNVKNKLINLSADFERTNNQLKVDSDKAKQQIDESVKNLPEYQVFQSIKSKIQDANTANALALEYYNNLKKLQDQKKEGLEDTDEYKKLLEINAKITSINPDELNNQSKDAGDNLNKKFKAKQNEVLNPLKNQYASSFKILSDEWKATYDDSFLSEVGKKYGLDAHGNINASQQQINSDSASKINDIKYEIYKQNGLVSDLPSYLPSGVSSFVKSNTYLNSTSDEKKYYLHHLFSEGKIGETGKTEQDFMNDMSGTITPKIDLVILKSMARDNYNKYVQLGLDADKKSGVKYSPFAGGSEHSPEAARFFTIADQFKPIADGDYENESGALNSFIKTFSMRDAIPFVGSLEKLSNAVEVKKVVDFVNKDKNNYNKLSPEDKGTFDAYGMAIAYNQLASPDIYHRLGSMTSSGVAFMGELAMTGGISNVVAKTLNKTVQNAIVDLGIKTAEWSPSVATSFASTMKLASEFLNPAALDMAANISGKLATKAIEYNVQTGLALTADVAENTVQKLTTKNPVYFSNDANGVINTIQETVHDSFASAAIKSWLSELATVSTMHISGMSITPLTESFLSKGTSFTEDQFASLAKSTGLDVQTLRFVRGVISDNKAADLISRVMISDIPVMREFKAIEKEIGFNPFDPATFEPSALKTFLTSARFGTFGSDVFKMFLNNRIQPIINGEKDDPSNWLEDTKNIAIGLAPIFAVGGLSTLAANLGTYRIRKEANKLNDFYSRVSTMTPEEYSSSDISSTLTDFRSKDAQDIAKQLLQERDRFDAGDIKLSNPDMSFKDYMNAKRESLATSANVIESLKTDDPKTLTEAQSAISKLQQAIDSSPSEDMTKILEFKRDQIIKYFDKPVEDRQGIYHEVKENGAEFARLDHMLSNYSLEKYRIAPSLLKERIDKLDIPDSMRDHLMEKYDYAQGEYQKEKDKYSIKTDNDGTPVSFNIKSFNDSEITFARNADGTGSVRGILDTGSNSPDLSAVSTEIQEMSTEHLRALENIINQTPSIPADFKQQVLKSALFELIKRFENIESVGELRVSDYSNMIDDIQDLSSRSNLTDEQKKALGNQIKRNVRNAVAEDNTEGNRLEMQKLMFTLYQNADIIDKNNLINIARAIGSMKEGDAVEFERTGADNTGFNEVNDVDIDTPPTAIEDKTQVRVGNYKLKRVKSFDKYISDNPTSSIAKIGKRIDELVTGKTETIKNEDGTETEVKRPAFLSENAANLIKNSIMSSDWLVKMLDVKDIAIDWEGKSKSSGSVYNPVTKSIRIKLGRTNESTVVRELMEELTHNAHHNLLIAIDSTQGADPRFNLTDADIEYISGHDRQDVNTVIAKYYKESKFNSDEFYKLKNLGIENRTSEEEARYSSILDYMSFMKSKFDKSDDKSLFNIDFNYNYNGSKHFNTKSVIENYDRFMAFRSSGYTSEQSAYYSMHTGEFFARTMSDRLIHSQLEYSESSPANRLYTQVTNFFSNNIKLPTFIRTVKSNVFDAEDLAKSISSLSSFERGRLEEVQSNQNLFLNAKDRDNWKEVNEIGKDYYDGVAPITKVKEYIGDGNYDKLGDLVQHLYNNTSSDKFETWLDHTVKQVNVDSGRVSLDTKGILDYLQASDLNGGFTGTLGEYLDKNGTDVLGAMRDTKVSIKKDKEEDGVHIVFYSGEKVGRIYRDSSTGWWRDADNFGSGFGDTRDLLSTDNKEDAIDTLLSRKNLGKYSDDLGAFRTTAQSIDYDTGKIVLKEGTKATIHIDDKDGFDTSEPNKLVSVISEDGRILGSAEFTKNSDSDKVNSYYSLDTYTHPEFRRQGVASAIYDFFDKHYAGLESSGALRPDGRKLWDHFYSLDSEVNPDELGAKRSNPLNLQFYTSLVANKKAGTTMSEQDLYKALNDIQNAPLGTFKNKSDQSQYANGLVQAWKQQYMRNELPRNVNSTISEQLKLTSVPFRSKLSNYKKDIDFIVKFTQDANYRDAYNQAKKSLVSAKNRYGSNFNDSVEFYMNLRKLAKIDLNMVDSAPELRTISDLLKTKRDDVVLSDFKTKVDDLYDKYIDAKDPAQISPSSINSPASIAQDQSSRNLAGFIKTVPLPQVQANDIYIKKLMDIDENNLSGASLKNYVRHLDFVRRNGVLDKKSYDYINNYDATVRSAEIMSKLNDKYVDMVNQKVNANPIADYMRGLFPFALLPDAIKGGDSLGNLSKYNVQDYLDFYDGFKEGYTGPLNSAIVEPMAKNAEQVKGAVEKALARLNPIKYDISQEDTALAGIYTLLHQSYDLEPISAQMAVDLNDHFNTDEYKQGSILHAGDQGHDFAMEIINEGLAKSAANSYGEDTGIGADKALANLKLVAEKRGKTTDEILKEREAFLTKFGADNIYDLAKELADGTITPDDKVTNWMNEVTSVFKDIKEGKYSDGLTLEQASNSRAGVPFRAIENYSPIIRYKADEIPVDFDNNNGNQKYFGFSQDLNMNESFLETRKNNVLALNTNLWEATSKKVDQQLFWLINSDHKNFLDSFLKTDLFDKSDNKSPKLSLSKDATNTIKQALNVYYNRGVTEGQIDLLKNKTTKALNGVLNNIKPFYVAAADKAPAQLSTVLGSTGAMKGMSQERLVSMTKGIKDYIDAMLDENHPLNTILREQAKEVYYRGLADYQIPLAENGTILSSTLLGGHDSGTYARSENSTYTSNLIDAIRSKDFNKSVMLAPLMFFDNMAARMSFAALYNNYCQYNGMSVDYGKPNHDAIRFAIQGVRKTQHTTNEIFAPMITKGIVPGEGNEQMFNGAISTMLLNSLYSFKTFSINETKGINKEQYMLRDNVSNGEWSKAGDNVQNLVALHASKSMFFLLKNLCSLPRLAFVSYLYSHGDTDKLKSRLSATVDGAFDWKNIMLKTALDDFTSPDVAKELASGIAKTVAEKAKGESLTTEEAYGFATGQTREGGFMASALMDGLTKAVQAGQTVNKDGVTETAMAQSGEAAMNIANLFGPKIGSAEINELLREWEKQSKLNSPVVIHKIDSKDKTKQGNAPVIEEQ